MARVVVVGGVSVVEAIVVKLAGVVEVAGGATVAVIGGKVGFGLLVSKLKGDKVVVVATCASLNGVAAAIFVTLTVGVLAFFISATSVATNCGSRRFKSSSILDAVWSII